MTGKDDAYWNFPQDSFKVKRCVMFLLKLSPFDMEADFLEFGILSPLLPSGGASEIHFHSTIRDHNYHFYICLIFKIITAEIITSHFWKIQKFYLMFRTEPCLINCFIQQNISFLLIILLLKSELVM